MKPELEETFKLFCDITMPSNETKRRKWSWTPLQKERSDRVMKVVSDLKPYWPLTLRQIYYQLVVQGHIKNNKSQYVMLSKLVKWMRIDDILPWKVLVDDTRRVTEKRGFESLEEFIDEQSYYFLRGYTRCLVQGQDKYVEVWCEKNALMRIFEDVVYPYCMRAVVCRGYQSITFTADFYNRALEAIGKGQTPVILYFGDLDPSGVQMFEATIETLIEEMGLWGVEYKRIDLTPEQINQYQLPRDPYAAKKSDPRYKRYAKKYGDLAVELDAVPPAVLETMIETAIRAELDLKDFAGQESQEVIDRERLKRFRADVSGLIQEKIEEMFDV